MDKWLWEHKENALDVACYPLWGSLREPQTTAVVTFIRQCLPAGNTHTHQHIHSTASTHWVMMGLSSPITACSSRLRSRAQSVKMDSSQEVLGPWILYFKPQKGLLQSLKTLNYLSSFPDTSRLFWTFCGQLNDYYMAQIGKKQGDKGNHSVILQCFLIHGQNCDE